MKIIIVLGAPGSGKSTQAKFIAEKLNLPHLSTGKLCRKISLENSSFGQKIKKIINSGEVLSDNLLLQILKKEIKGEKYKKGFTMEGTPRNFEQAKLLNLKIDKVFYLQVGDEVSKKRLLKRAKIEKRDDDAPEVIKRRLEIFHSEIEPIISYYKNLGILVKVNGELSVEEIKENIFKYL